MLYHRPAQDRGHANFGWLDSQHSFSFGNYYDPAHMGLSVLRVINDDTVTAGAGFGTHGHQDMEIISYVLSGAIEHEDSMGNRFVVPAGDVQRMSAGTGVTHSEFNHSQTEALHFLQIWIQPNVKSSLPSYEQKKVVQNGPLTPIVTPDGRDGSLSMQQDASISRVQLEKGESIEFNTLSRAGYLHVIEGAGRIDDLSLSDGDGLGAYQESITLHAGDQSMVALWFDLPVTAA